MKVLDLYVDPAEFFRSEVGPGKQSLRGPVCIIVGLIALSLIDLLVMQRQFFTLVNQSVLENPRLTSAARETIIAELEGVKPLVLAGAGFSSLYFLLLWPLLPAVLSNVASLFDRDYQFREMLRCSGLAFLAFYPCQIICTILLFWPIRLPYNPILASRGVSEFGTDLADFAALLRNSFPLAPVRAMNWAALFWFAVVVVIGFRQVYRLKWPAAVLSVGGIGLLFLGGNYLVACLVGR